MQARAIRAGLWLTVPIAAVLMLASVGDPVTESIRYLITWTLSVLVPGVLLWRVLAAGRSTAQDLGFGAVLGLCWELAVWAAFTALGVPRLQWIAVAALLLTFALVPPLRRHLRLSSGESGPRWWQPVMVACLLLAMLRTTVGLLRAWPLPPIAFARNQDVWYQLGLIQMLRRDVTPPDPSVLGEPLIYHWFANASIASQSVMANVDPSHLLIHQWQLTFVISLVLAGWAAGEALSGKAWVGPVAGALTGVLPGTLQLAEKVIVEASPAQVVQGPTGALAVLVMLGLVGPTVLILRKHSSPGVWIAMALMIGLATGTKPTVLPIMLVGGVVAGLFAWISERRIPWRIVAIGGLAGAFFLAATFALTGSTGGSRIQLLAALRVQPFYQSVSGDRSYPATGGWVLPSVETGDPRLLLFAATLLVYFLLINSERLLSLLGTTLDPARRDPAYWWVWGCVAAGTGITLVFSHTGYSEYHFVRTVTALGVVGAVSVASTLIGPETRWRPVLIAAAAGFVTAWLIRLFWFEPPDLATDVAQAILYLLVPFQLLAVVAVVVVVATRVRSSAMIALQVIALVIAAGLPNQLAIFSTNLYHTLEGKPVDPKPESRVYLTTNEQEAAIWLRRQARTGDVAVTNVFCMPAPYRPGCPDDAFWVSGLSGVQLYLGGWAYAPANLTATRHQTSFLTQPPPWPDRLKDSLDAVRRPTPALLGKLRNQVGVDWIVADLRAGPVSPRLDRLADLSYSNQDMRIYKLR